MGNTPSTHAVRQANLQRLLNPRSIAVVGASVDAAKAGSQALLSLKSFPGTLVAVHPREKEIQGVTCYPTFAELPEPVDLAILAIPAQHCVQAAKDAAARGVGGVFIISGGFGETGGQGAKLQEQLAEVCRSTGLRLLGPNTSGFINTHERCVASFVPGVDQLKKGSVAVVAQSGGVNLSISFLLDQLGKGISLAVGLGNAVDVNSADVIEMLGTASSTKAIALHLEGVPNGRALNEALRKVTPFKPVVALVAGRADIGEFAVSHTGNLMGSHARTVSALQQAGVVVVNSTEELAQAAAALADGRLPPKQKNGIGLVTGQAGPGLLIVDGLKCADVDVPLLSPDSIKGIEALLPPMTFVKNPVDTGRPSPTFPQVVTAVAQDQNVDAVLVFGLSEPAVLNPVEALKPAKAATGKPVIFGSLGLAHDLQGPFEELMHEGIPAVRSPERLVLVAAALDADSRAQWRLANSEGGSRTANNDQPRLQGPFNEDTAKALLAKYGVSSPARRLCIGRAEALKAFEELRKPLVVKIAADDVPHKTEVGGVFLNVRDQAGMEKALASIERIPTETPGRFLVEEMAGEGVELIVGAVRDASWGPCVVIGLGGILAEAVSDSSVRLAPLTELDAQEMLSSLRGKKVLDGFRHLPKCDRASIAKVAIALGDLLEEHPEIAEVEINPLRVHADGALALDALVVLKETT
ncbi:acetate--CoA ligase family protein [Variovorax sp. YR216]|uniref:acetate--CoA ligase family protein n=1 Tax=Variovorax sp. YR216 TaxID=1882828 RepID=UPI000896567B|nr:acetate--CoA ligase family protein [Variovorax sp. YR216]SEA85926.1 acetyltransferase [Variovorax sp. YR216]